MTTRSSQLPGAAQSGALGTPARGEGLAQALEHPCDVYPPASQGAGTPGGTGYPSPVPPGAQLAAPFLPKGAATRPGAFPPSTPDEENAPEGGASGHLHSPARRAPGTPVTNPARGKVPSLAVAPVAARDGARTFPPEPSGAGSAGGKLPGGAERPAAAEAAAPPGNAMGREWVLVFPAGIPLLSANGREHHMARYRKGRALKDAAIVMARKAKIPPLERITVTVLYDPPDRRHRDHDNLAPNGKHISDGIVIAGVVPDDTPEYVVPGRCEITETVYPRGRLRVVVTELPSAGAA